MNVLQLNDVHTKSIRGGDSLIGIRIGIGNGGNGGSGAGSTGGDGFGAGGLLNNSLNGINAAVGNLKGGAKGGKPLAGKPNKDPNSAKTHDKKNGSTRSKK